MTPTNTSGAIRVTQRLTVCWYCSRGGLRTIESVRILVVGTNADAEFGLENVIEQLKGHFAETVYSKVITSRKFRRAGCMVILCKISE